MRILGLIFLSVAGALMLFSLLLFFISYIYIDNGRERKVRKLLRPTSIVIGVSLICGLLSIVFLTLGV